MRNALRWGRSRPGRRAAIVGYHRIADQDWDPFELGIPPSWFAEHLEILNERARPMNLRDLAAALTRGELPHRAVVLTFDDGYVNVLETAKPLLQRFEIPATLFVVADALGQEFWWDELTRLLRPDRDLPSELRLELDDRTHAWPVKEAGQRRRAAIEIGRRVMVFQEKRIRGLLDALWNQAGGRPEESERYRCMTAEELRLTAGGGLIEIGSHTRTHPVLARRPVEEQRSEIAESKTALEAAAGEDVVSFSYPNGSRCPATVKLVREAGYLGACNSERDVVRRGIDPWDLPRFWLPRGNGQYLSRWLDRWLV